MVSPKAHHRRIFDILPLLSQFVNFVARIPLDILTAMCYLSEKTRSHGRSCNMDVHKGNGAFAIWQRNVFLRGYSFLFGNAVELLTLRGMSAVRGFIICWR